MREGTLGFRRAQTQAARRDSWENTDYLGTLFKLYEKKVKLYTSYLLDFGKPFVYTICFISQQPHEIGSMIFILKVMKLKLREAK